MTFTWANGRQLQSVIKDSKTYTFEYNADGIRTHKNNPDATQSLEYVIDESGRIAGLKRHNVWVATYVYDENNSPIGMRLGTTEYWFVKNLQGDIIEVVNNAGTVLANYYYDEWGVPTAVYKGIVGERLVGKNNIFLYRGYVYDWETGLYYLNSRYYDPVVGRFINADVVVADVGGDARGYNMYAYCFNNPVNMSDETGNWPKWVNNVVKKIGKLVSKVKAVINYPSTLLKISVASTAAMASGQATAEEIINDVKNYDFFNDDETKVLESKVFSSYNGTPVIRHEMPNITSFSVCNTIVLNRNENEENGGIDTVRHEWGHTVNEALIGTPKYLIKIALPSVIGCIYNPSSQVYYSLPWERSADYFGEAERSFSYIEGSEDVSVIYFMLP